MNSFSPLKILLLLLLVALLLIPLRWVPAFTVAGYEVKPVDMLSDVWPGGSGDLATTDTIALPPTPQVKPAFRDSCPAGMTCIADYAFGNAKAGETERGMRPLYEALENRATLGRPVRIAYFGDSFIESDILTDGFREQLQTAFGGEGVGFVDINPPYAANRVTVQQRASGWSGHCLLDKSGWTAANLGIGQRYFVPVGEGGHVEVRGVKKPGLGAFSTTTLYLKSCTPVAVTATLANIGELTKSTRGTGEVEALTFEGRTSSARISLANDAPGTVAWGIAAEGKNGVTVDNFSLRGSSGTTLLSIPLSHLQQFGNVRPYDLIVLQFGLNAAQKHMLKYDAYMSQMRRVVEHMKKAFPHAGILIVSVGDREDKLSDGELHTMPGIKALVRYQEVLAADCGTAFWNLYEGMGGEGSIKRMAEARPAEAAKDYTHLSHRGGRRLGKVLFKSLHHGYKQYLKRKAYEKEE